MIECIRFFARGTLILSLFASLCGPLPAQQLDLVIPGADSSQKSSDEETSDPPAGNPAAVGEIADEPLPTPAPAVDEAEAGTAANEPATTGEPVITDENVASNQSSQGKPFKSAINFVFDCSGSMGLRDVPTADGNVEQRGKICKEAVGAAINDLQDSDVGVGLLLFGHRSFWTKTKEGKYEVVLSEMGEKQQLKLDNIDPSFDFKQEVEIAAPTKTQIAQMLEVLSEVTFNRGAQAPCYQSIDEAVSELAQLPDRVTNRGVIVITDGFNQLADAEAASKDFPLQDLAEKVLSHNREKSESRVRIHLIMFGKTFEKNDDGEFTTADTKTRVEALVKLAEDSGGSLQTAIDAEALANALNGLIAASDSKRSGKIVGEIHKNKSIVSNSEFKVTLEGEGSNFKPVTTKDGKFVFDSVPTGKKYLLKVSGRIRNRTYDAEQKDVESSTKSTPEPVRISLE